MLVDLFLIIYVYIILTNKAVLEMNTHSTFSAYCVPSKAFKEDNI